MLHEFITDNRDELVALVRKNVGARNAPRATDEEMESGVPLFLKQLVERLHHLQSFDGADAGLCDSATMRGGELLRRGFSVGQVVHAYGAICQAVTELAVERNALITNEEFKMLNGCLDDAIAGAVTEFGRLRERSLTDESTERMGEFAHELRNLLGVALMSYASIERGSVGVGGSTGAIHTRALLGIRDLIDRSLTEVRLTSGNLAVEDVPVWEALEDVAVAACLVAQKAGKSLTTAHVSPDVVVRADRQLLASALSNLVLNAIKFTRTNGHVTVRARVTADRVLIDIENECGGIPGNVDDLFRPYAQRSSDRPGLGLGLSISMKAVRACGGDIRVSNSPGTGCIFTVELQRVAPT